MSFLIYSQIEARLVQVFATLSSGFGAEVSRHYLRTRSSKGGAIYEATSNLGKADIILYTNYSTVTFKDLIICENRKLVNYSSSPILDTVVADINQRLEILNAVRVLPFNQPMSHFMDNVKVAIQIRLNKHSHVRNQFRIDISINKEDCILFIDADTSKIMIDQGLSFHFKEDELYMADSWTQLKEKIHTTYQISIDKKDVNYSDLGAIIDMTHL